MTKSQAHALPDAARAGSSAITEDEIDEALRATGDLSSEPIEAELAWLSAPNRWCDTVPAANWQVEALA